MAVPFDGAQRTRWRGARSHCFSRSPWLRSRPALWRRRRWSLNLCTPPPTPLIPRPPVLNRANDAAASVAPRARRVPRADRGLRRSWIQRQSRGPLLPVAPAPERDDHAGAPALVSGAGTGCARRPQDRGPDRRAVQRAVRHAHGLRRRRRMRKAASPSVSAARSWCTATSGWSGTSAGSNAARTFDAAKLTVRGKRLSVDVFAASVVRILDGEFDKSGNGNRFAGAYATAPALVPAASVEPYAVLEARREPAHRNGDAGHARLATMGVRWIGRLPAGLEYNTDTALQTGSLGTRRRQRVGRSLALADAAGWPRSRSATSGEFNYASGDDESDRRHARHVRSALPDAARQVRPRRSGRLAEHPPRCAPASS